MTYDELKTNIANFLNRSDLTDQLDFFIDATESEFNRRLRNKDMVKRATATADGQYMSLPTDWLEAINIEITSNDFRPLFQQSLESLDVYRKANNNITTSAKLTALKPSDTDSFSTFSLIFDFLRIPAVSKTLILFPFQSVVNDIASRVIPASGPVSNLSSLIILLISVDFPAFGRPTTATCKVCSKRLKPDVSFPVISSSKIGK